LFCRTNSHAASDSWCSSRVNSPIILFFSFTQTGRRVSGVLAIEELLSAFIFDVAFRPTGGNVSWRPTNATCSTHSAYRPALEFALARVMNVGWFSFLHPHVNNTVKCTSKPRYSSPIAVSRVRYPVVRRIIPALPVGMNDLNNMTDDKWFCYKRLFDK
jgi:hypothetical protein